MLFVTGRYLVEGIALNAFLLVFFILEMNFIINLFVIDYFAKKVLVRLKVIAVN